MYERGHRIVFFERDVPYYSATRDLRELETGSLCLYENWAEVEWLASHHLSSADVAIVTSYCPDGVAATRAVLGSGVPIKCFYDLDTPVTLSAIEAGEFPEYLDPRGLGDFDLVLSFTGGRTLDEIRRKLGARNVFPLYGSVDPRAFAPHPKTERRALLSYLGTYAADRHAVFETLFMEPARRRPAERFLIGGAQYPSDFPWLPNIEFKRHLAPPELPAFYASARLTLNVTRRAMARMGYCPSGRLFEAAACGAPIVTDWWEGIDTFFVPQREIIVARSTEQVLAAFELSDRELESIAGAARERALSNHTAARRAEELEHLLEQHMSSTQPLAEAS
jgi:spore maturation protein CgeB